MFKVDYVKSSFACGSKGTYLCENMDEVRECCGLLVKEDKFCDIKVYDGAKLKYQYYWVSYRCGAVLGVWEKWDFENKSSVVLSEKVLW